MAQFCRRRKTGPLTGLSPDSHRTLTGSRRARCSQLIKYSRLEELDIRDTNMTDAAAKRLTDTIVGHRTLRVISEMPLEALKSGALLSLECRDRNYGPMQTVDPAPSSSSHSPEMRVQPNMASS